MTGGRLKERDALFELVLKWITHPEWDMTLTLRDAMAKTEHLIDEHIVNPAGSELSRKCPGVASFYTRLPLIRALDFFGSRVSVEERQYVPPTFSEVRQVFNIAQVYEMRGHIKMLTFDADDTLYEHGMDLEPGDWIVDALLMLLESGIYVAVVTAAGYPGKPDRYAARFKGLLTKMKQLGTPKEVTDRFYCVGGECNYLFRIKEGYAMEQVPLQEWATDEMKAWKEEDISRMLDLADTSLREACVRHKLDVQYLRKERAVGCYPTEAGVRIAYETLEDVALTLQDVIMTHPDAPTGIPFCAFNGNRDVWVDIGDKRIGIQALQQYLKVGSKETCHLGDRFTNTGNDARARNVAMTVWVTNPLETEQYLEIFLSELGTEAAKKCAETRPTGPRQGTVEWEKAQVVQKNTAS